jgi:hypothetical protein
MGVFWQNTWIINQNKGDLLQYNYQSNWWDVDNTIVYYTMLNFKSLSTKKIYL